MRPSRGARIGIAVVSMALVVTAAWVLWPAREPPVSRIPVAPLSTEAGTTPTVRSRVVVAMFANRTGDPDDAWLSEGLPEMLTTDLARSGGLEVISTQRLYDLLAMSGRSDVATLDRGTATELARWAGAGVVISGSIFRSGSSYRIDVQAHDTTSGQVVAASRVEGDDVFQMADQLAADLREGLQIAVVGDQQLDELTTSSPQAYRLYAHGIRLYEHLRYAEAAAEFRRALAADPSYATAQLRLGMSLMMSGERDDGMLWIGRAAGRAASMPEQERLLAEGLQAQFVAGDQALAEQRLRELIRLRPQEVEPLVWLAQNLSDDPLEAIKPLRSAIDLDPNDPFAVAALVGQLRALGLPDDADAILDNFMQRNPTADDGPFRDFRIDFLRTP
jgi:TolB-like protein